MKDYSIGIKELDEAIGGIRKGANIILIGPPMSGKEAILNHIAYYGSTKEENAVIMVTTRESAGNILNKFKEYKLDLPMNRIGIVDCVTKTLGVSVIENENVKIASSPVDLTGIGVKISQFLEEFMIKKHVQKMQLHINSLSTILMYSNIQTVFRFLHVFTGRIKAAGALGIYVIDLGMHDEQAITTLKQLGDGLIEVKSENDKSYIRVTGFSTKPTPWFEFETNGMEIKIVGGA